MNESDFAIVRSRLVQLFPKATLNDAQGVAWLFELKGLPLGHILDALDAVYAEKPNWTPAAGDVRSKAEAIGCPDRVAEGDDPADWLRKRWSRLRPEYAGTYAGWDDATVFYMHQREVFQWARLRLGKGRCLQGYWRAWEFVADAYKFRMDLAP